MSNEAIIIRVTNKYWGGEEMLFKIKQSTKMSKVFRHYEKANGIKKGSSFYMFGDRRVSETDSAQSLHIEDNSQIDCCLSSTFTEPETDKTLLKVKQNVYHFRELLLGSDELSEFISSDSEDYSKLGTYIATNTRLQKLQIKLHDTAGLDAKNSTFFDGLKRNSSIKKLSIDFGGRGIVGVGLEILKAYHNDKHLTHLSIKTKLYNGSENAIASTLRGCTNLTNVKLSNNDITDEQLLPMIEAIKGRPLLERLELCKNRIEDDGSQALATLLEDQNCNLQCLDLTGNNITNKGVRLVADSLVSNTKLKALYLKKNPAYYVQAIFSSLLCDRSSINSTYKSNHTLIDLEVGDLVRRTGGYLHSLLEMNEGTDKSRVASDKILKYHPKMALPSSVFEWDEEGKRTLKSLPHVIDWFDEAISASPLNRVQTNIEARKLSVIFQFALAMPTLFVPIPHGRRVEKNDPTLTALTIARRDGSSDAYTRYTLSVGNDYDRLGAAIGKNSYLTDLIVSATAPTLDVSNRGFFEGLKQNTSICNLSLGGRIHNQRSPLVGGIIHEILNAYQDNNNNLTRIAIKHIVLQNGGEQILAANFRRCTNLRKIQLHRCRINDEQLLPMVDALRGHSSLELLDLDQNQIGSIGCEAISSLLTDPNSKLIKVVLRSNNIDDEGVNILVNSLVGNTKLKYLYLDDNHIDPSLTFSVFSNLLCNKLSLNGIHSSNHTIKKLVLPSNFPQQMEEELETLLDFNIYKNKSCVATLKILGYHPIIDVKELFEWDKEGEQTLKSLPYLLSWFERAAKAVRSLKDKSNREKSQRKTKNWKLSAIYEYAKAMPLEFVSASHNIKVVDGHCQGKKKRKRDDM